MNLLLILFSFITLMVGIKFISADLFNISPKVNFGGIAKLTFGLVFFFLMIVATAVSGWYLSK